MVCLEYINFEHNTVAAELVRQTYDTPPLAFVHSYGCQQNVNDGERIKGALISCLGSHTLNTASPCASTFFKVKRFVSSNQASSKSVHFTATCNCSMGVG